ncbi:hypothetical protein ES319_A09G175700v1 [Gossypium barbadense]|uniref:Uncharacterized protein n=1 Tax=Gossypium barbadense TaxID=3634 RepID=A0A5J5UIL7_GOSBA|nr:hypothetical protein ES319_A09G175700v1 [Gossypium barbadense]
MMRRLNDAGWLYPRVSLLTDGIHLGIKHQLV